MTRRELIEELKNIVNELNEQELEELDMLIFSEIQERGFLDE